MKIVIDIPDNEYLLIKNSEHSAFADFSSKECMMHAIRNGTPYEERPTGHWINRCRGSSFCSVCGGEEPTEDIEFMNYCPNCGADMRGCKE